MPTEKTKSSIVESDLIEVPVASRRIAEFIKQFERFRSKAYKDVGGIWTIGYGQTAGVKEGMEIDEQQALKFLFKEIDLCERAIHRYVKVPLNQNQYDALVSWIYNCGIQAFRNSTLLRVLNEGQYDLVPKEIKRWNKVNGKVVKGLTRRRKDEAELFTKKET